MRQQFKNSPKEGRSLQSKGEDWDQKLEINPEGEGCKAQTCADQSLILMRQLINWKNVQEL